MTTFCHTCRHYKSTGKNNSLCCHPSQLDMVTGRPIWAFRARAAADQCGPDARLYERSAVAVYVMPKGFDLAAGWQPIDTAPKDGTDVLLFLPTYKRQVWLGHYSVRETFSHGELEFRYEEWSIGLTSCTDKPEPTHWMPVPAGPDAAPAAALVCEGFATAARLAEATGAPVEVAFSADWSNTKRFVLAENSQALLEAVGAIVSNAFAPGTGITAGPSNDERKALAEAGVTCLLEQAARALTLLEPA